MAATEDAAMYGYYDDYKTDSNADGIPDFLTIDVGVNIKTPGEYTLIGYLNDIINREVAYAIDHKNLSVGSYDMQLNFDGKSIQKHNVLGYYRLKDVTLASGSSNTDLNICDYIPDAYITSLINPAEFAFINSSNRIVSEHKISGSGSGDLLLTVSICESIPLYSGTYGLDLLGLHIPPFSSDFKVSTGKHSGYAYESEGIYMPGMPNNFSVSASGVKNLNIGLKKQQGSYENSSNVWTDKYTRIWISSQAVADEKNVAKLESYLISPGIYQAKIFGEAAESVSQVNLTMTLVKRVIIDGRFNLSINTTGFPSGDYSITAKALNGTFKLDELEIEGI